jgi:hypothetical protein
MKSTKGGSTDLNSFVCMFAYKFGLLEINVRGMNERLQLVLFLVHRFLSP